MSSLFWKIFLWFWIAMLILGSAIAWSTYYFHNSDTENIMGSAYKSFMQDSHTAAQILAQQGLQPLQQWATSHKHSNMEMYVLNLRGEQLLGKPIPEQIRQLAQRGSGRQQPHWLYTKMILPFGEAPYQLITTFVRPNPVRLLFTPPRILIALLVSGLVCLWLTQHLIRPVSQLRHATQKLSAGDLDVRISPQLGRRSDELGMLAADFDRMAEQLQSLISSQQDLIRDVSHELRSPLARLQVALELARQRSDGSIDSELDRIEKETERLNELIGQMLALERMKARHIGQLELAQIDLRALLESIAEDVSYEAQNKQCEIKLTLAQDAGINGDETLLHSALQNVIQNAVKYTANHSSIEITLRKNNMEYIVSVRDHGEGVPQNRLADLFKPFVRISSARDRQSGGYGLGLAIAERAIRLHRGNISATNAVGGGLQIDITLPVSAIPAN